MTGTTTSILLNTAVELFFLPVLWEMNQLFLDSMAICHIYRKPDISLTITANPNWPEIQDQLLWEVPLPPGANYQRRKEKASDRPDIVVCVFEEKKRRMLS